MTLRDLRKQAGLTVAEVAKALGVTNNAVINYECGVRQVDIKKVLILAELYDVTEKEIIDAQLSSIPSR